MASRLACIWSVGQAAQSVVGAELDHDVARLVGQQPIEAGEAAGRGVAADAGVDHLAVVAIGGEAALQLGREGVLEGDAEARGQRITQHRDPTGLRRRSEA